MNEVVIRVVTQTRTHTHTQRQSLGHHTELTLVHVYKWFDLELAALMLIYDYLLK